MLIVENLVIVSIVDHGGSVISCNEFTIVVLSCGLCVPRMSIIPVQALGQLQGMLGGGGAGGAQQPAGNQGVRSVSVVVLQNSPRSIRSA